MPNFVLDGQTIEFEPGESILHAALRHGNEIPHYCYHPGLSVVATCRQCLIDVTDMGNGKGMPKLQASCSTPAANGMKVVSNSEKVIAAQNEINEYLLVNHPLDCPICDQAGECRLQDFAFKYGTGHSEMEYEKRVYGWRDVGSYIMLERNRCVHCSRCERFSREVEGEHDFGMFLRSHELTFDTFEDHQIGHIYQGNLVDICPVGAITEREFRFRKRVWKLKKTHSVCPSCSTGCNVTVEQDRNHVERLKPRENPAVNRWWMCDVGRLNYRELNDRESRYLEPLARIKGELHSAAWDAVYGAVATKAKQLGAQGEQVIGLVDTRATNEELHQFRALLGDLFGSTQVFFPLRPVNDPPAKNFLHSLHTSDPTPNQAGAIALGLTGDVDDKRLLAALKRAPKIVFILGSPFADDAAIREGTIRENAGKAELIVQIAVRRDAWGQKADVILPGQTFAEKAGTFTNKQNRVQRIQRAIHPPEGTRDEVRILQELARAFGQERPMLTAPEALAQIGGAFKGMSWDQVGDLGAPLAGAPLEGKA
jgi:NADH-quinone oxidoreductase subunit G